MHFSDHGLDPRLLEAVDALGFEAPTPIQDAALPPLLAGRDVVGRARTGSGKTAAFGLPLLHRLRDGCDGVGGLILAPTRELAMQVTEALRSFATKLPLRIVCIYGGTPYDPQLAALRRGTQIVVGTPGRVLDLAERGALKLGQVQWFVLDEADEMLNMGFFEDVERVLELLPDTRQIALFSATMPAPIRRVADRTLVDPELVSVEENAMSVDHIEQRWMRVPRRHKPEALARILAGEPRGTTLVFARTRRGCAEVADTLAARGVAVDALHGDLSQPARERVLSRLRSGGLDVVIATDVAARGIDVAHLTHVVNYDLPDDPGSYTHRIGRTGRAGRAGVAISLVAPGEIRRLKGFERAVKAKITEVGVPSDAEITRRQHEALGASLRLALEDGLEAARAVVAGLDLPAEDVAAAALELLARAQGIPLDVDVPDDRPPAWTQRQGSRPGAARDERPTGPTNEVQLFLPIGKVQGVGPGDLVGALAGEGGISGDDIGKIEIEDKVSFVGLSRANAEKVLARMDRIEIRGKSTPVLLARPRPSGPPGPRMDRPDRGGGRSAPNRPPRKDWKSSKRNG